MALPETIRVKISSEEAGSISLTAVVAREMPVRELIETMLGATGKDAARIGELLRRGSFVSGASRLRWSGWAADPDAIAAVLATFPDADPGRPFERESCVRAVLKGTPGRVEIERAAGSARRLFRRRSFWDALMDLAEASAPAYAGYSYRHRADHYSVALTPAATELLRESAGAIRYSTLEAAVRRARVESVELYVERAAR
ncbi:MAG: hypothetical protein ABSH46_21310 [Bryobacteraceae bacterium]